MENCYEGMRRALVRNIEGLLHLSAQQREALLAEQMDEAILASEAGRPFVEIYPEEGPAADARAGATEAADDPATKRALARAKARATFAPAAPSA